MSQLGHPLPGDSTGTCALVPIEYFQILTHLYTLYELVGINSSFTSWEQHENAAYAQGEVS